MSEGGSRARGALRPAYRLTTQDYVTSLEIARDGSSCVAGLGDGRVVGFEPTTGRETFSIAAAHPGGILGISVAPDGRHFVTCGHEPVAKVWSAEGALVRELPGHGTAWVEHVAWAPAGGRIATACGKTVHVWTAQGEPIVESDPLASTISGLAWRTDGTELAACCYGGVHILSFVAGAKTRHLPWKGSLISLAWSPDAKVVACGSQDSSVHFWRLATGRDSQMSGYPSKPKALAWDAESKLLATAGDSTITVWDFRGKGPEGTRPLQLRSHMGLCTRLAFHPSKGLLASGSPDTLVLLWEPRKGSDPIRFGFLEDHVTGLCWHPKQPFVIGADASGIIGGWAVG